MHENAINITNLKPGYFYVIRLLAANASNFQAVSDLIRVRTSDDRRGSADSTDDTTVQPERNPVVVPYKTTTDSQSHNGTTQIATREHSGSISHPKRHNLLRRPSPVILNDTTTPPSELSAEPVESIPDLANKLENIRREIEELERQDEDDEKQFDHGQTSLVERREQLRQQLKERDDESNDLKRNVTSLERQTTAGQTRRSKQEKLLSQRRTEREKFRAETSRWEKEAIELHNEAERLAAEKEGLLEFTRDQLQTVRQDQEADLQSLRALEERLADTRKDIKDLEEEQERLEGDPSDAVLLERQNKIRQEELEWNSRMAALQDRYNSALALSGQAQYQLAQLQHRLDFQSSLRNNQSNHFSPALVDPPLVTLSEASGPSTIAGSRNSFVQDHHRMPSLPRSSAPGPLTFQSPSPFFNSANPISAPARSPLEEGMTEAEAEMLTGGALASPTAGALLPAGLLGDDSEDTQADVGTSDIPYLPGLGEDPGPQSPEAFEDTRGDVISPLLPDSHSPSAISSPHGSIQNFHQYKLSDSRMDSDRRSIRSTSSSTRAGPSRRIADYLGIPRNRAISNEGLPLGSLKQHESQSLPHSEVNAGELSGRTVSTKRGGFSGGLFAAFNKMGSTSNKVLEEPEDVSTSSTPAPARNAPFGLFGPKGNNIWATARTTASRPASTYSNYSMENALPRPSGDFQPFGWPASEALEQPAAARHASISYPWASLPSRRQSIAPKLDESSNSLSYFGAEEPPIVEASTVQAPIGTRPSKFRREAPPKQLNPAARDFRSLLSRDKNRDKSKKMEASLPVSEDEQPSTSPLGDTSFSSEPRKSKEARTSSAAESTDEVTEEVFGSPAKFTEGAKESFMRKMTRKGSSSKFSLSSSLKEKGGSLFSRKDRVSSEDVEDDEPGPAPSRSLESSGSGSQATSDKKGLLSSFRRRKKGNDTPSISEASMASETGDEGDERPSVDFSEG